ncbi:MAG: hypothetical protein ACFE8U_01350 [Candidatus Hermodarchaeota archaeon]
MNISDTQNVKVIYRRWTLLIPVLIVIIGGFLLIIVGPYNSAIGMIGGLIVLIGVFTLAALFSVVLGLEFASRTLAKNTRSQSSFREKIEANERVDELNDHN